MVRENISSRSSPRSLTYLAGSLLHCNSIQATEAEMDEMTKRMKQLAERPAEDITKEYKGKDSALSNADLSRTRRSRPHIGTPSNDFEAENLPAQVNEDMVIIEPKSNVQQNLLNKKTEAKLDPVEGGGRRSHRKGSSLQSSTLDRERAENRYLLSEHTRVAAINRGGSYSVESTTSLVKHLEILDAFALIRDDILKIGDVKPLIGRFKRGGSTTENAEDAIATAHILWIYMMALYTNVHVHQDDGLSSIFEVARLAKLLLDSARIKVQDWNGRVAIEKRINSILDKTEADGPAARKDILRVASRKFNLLYSSQRSRLRRMWHQQTPSDLQDVKVKHATSRSPARGISSPDSALRTPSRRGRSLAARDSTLPNEPYASPTSVKRENITPRSSDDGPFYPPLPPPILVLPEASPKHERRQNQAQSLSPYRQQQRRSSLFERTERWADSDSDDPTPHDPHHAAHRTASRRRWSNGSWGSHCASDEAPASGSADLEEEGFANFRGDEESPAFRCLDDDDDSEGGTHSVGSGEMAGRYGNAKECSVADRIEYKDEDGNRNGDGDIVDDLLAQWTTLPHMR